MQRSQAASSGVVSNVPEEVDPGKVLETPDQTGNVNEKRKSRIITEEAKFREMEWETLRIALGRFADEGDVQMYSMLSVVVPGELRVDKRRIPRFLGSYIDILAHLPLYSSAAYIREFSQVEDVHDTTGLETTIYTSCGRCRKAIVTPSASLKSGFAKGRYSYCWPCQKSVLCSICRLPVEDCAITLVIVSRHF